nr:cytochrome c oxidase subunit II-like, transmembrane domain-containing protein [Tanacetum cinerariifolium]
AHDLKIAGSNPVPAYFDFEKDPFKVDSKQALCNIVGSLYVRRDHLFWCSTASALRAFFTIGVIEGNMMAPSNDEIVPSHSGSGGPSHSPSWKEDSFEINVLLEESETEGTSARSLGAARDEVGPSRQDYVVINRSFEASMRNRILRLEKDDSPYLLGKAKGTYWSDIRLMLEHASSQNEYNQLLEFENKDLQIRELQHECFWLFDGFLKQNPPLSDQVLYNLQEAFKDFLNEDYEKRDQRFPFLIFDR